MKPIKCSVGGCSSKSDSCRLFCFPKNEKLRSLWLYYVAPTNPNLLTLLLDTLLNRRVCERHFPKDHFDCEGQRIRYSYPCLIKETEILLGEPLVDTEGDSLSDHSYSHGKDGKGADPKLEDLKVKGKTQRKKVANLFLRSESGKASRDLLDKCLTESALITSEPIPVIPAFGVVEVDPLLEEKTTESIDQIEGDFENVSNTNKVKVEFNPNICRTCLIDSAVTSLSDYCNDGATLGTMLERITGVKMEDGLPFSICFVCNRDLQQAIAFCRRAQNADKTLRENIALMIPSDDVACPRFKGKIKFDILDVDKKLKTDDECLKTKQIVEKSKPQNDPKSSVEIKLGLQKNMKTTPKIQKTVNTPTFTENKSLNLNKIYADTSGLKLKAIDISQIPISQLNKVQMIKLQPHTEQKQFQTETNPKVTTGIAIRKSEQKELNNDAQQKKSDTHAIKTSSEGLKLLLVKSESDLLTKEAVCPRCNKRFSSIEVMKQHYISHLPKKRLFMCLSCGKKSNSRCEALNHLKTHKENAKRQSRIQCEECGILVRTQNELIKHINRKHKGERPHKCTECNKCFFYHFDLLQHSKTHLPKESRERPVACTVCGKSFFSKKNLLSHVKCHSNTSKFECKVCGRNFMRQPNLYKHERLVHGRCNKNDTTELAIFSNHYTVDVEIRNLAD